MLSRCLRRKRDGAPKALLSDPDLADQPPEKPSVLEEPAEDEAEEDDFDTPARLAERYHTAIKAMRRGGLQ